MVLGDKTVAPVELNGCIPRIERQESHYNFMWAVRPPVVMVGLIHAARICMHDEPFFPPETDVILTSTISDDTLATFSFQDELKIIRALNPEWVIPFDFPVYRDMNSETRLQHTKQVASGSHDMQYILSNLSENEIRRVCDVKNLPRELVEPVQNTTVIPLIKGTSTEERRICIETAKKMDAPVIAKYGAQYMTVTGNGSHKELCKDLSLIHDESDGHPMLVIGLLSPDGRYSLEKVPPNVVAAAGTNQWVKRVNPTQNSTREMRDAYETLHNGVSATLQVPSEYDATVRADVSDTPPQPLSKNPGGAVGDDLSASISGAVTTDEYGFGQRKRPEGAMSARQAGHFGGKQSEN